MMLAPLAGVAGTPSADAAMAFKAAGYGAAARAGYLPPLDFERLRGPARPAAARSASRRIRRDAGLPEEILTAASLFGRVPGLRVGGGGVDRIWVAPIPRAVA